MPGHIIIATIGDYAKICRPITDAHLTKFHHGLSKEPIVNEKIRKRATYLAQFRACSVRCVSPETRGVSENMQGNIQGNGISLEASRELKFHLLSLICPPSVQKR